MYHSHFPNIPQRKPWTHEVVKEELLKLCPTLELDKQDVDVIGFCVHDMLSYMDFLHVSYPEIPTKTMDVYENGMCIGELINMTLDKDGNVVPSEAVEELVSFIKCFVGMWWKKYQIRVKITFTLPKDSFDSSNPPTMPQFTEEERTEITSAIKNVLLRYGEICCPEIIAISMLASYIRHNPKKEWSVEAKLNLRTALTRQGKQMAYFSGPLIFMKPNLKKINSALGEFRNDDAAKIT